MSDWLREQVRRQHLLSHQAEAARLWASDVAELGRTVPIVGYGRPVEAHGVQDDVMRIKLRERVRDVEQRLGGASSPSHLTAWSVAIEGRTAGEAASLLGVRTTTAMDLLWMALEVVAVVYGIISDERCRRRRDRHVKVS